MRAANLEVMVLRPTLLGLAGLACLVGACDEPEPTGQLTRVVAACDDVGSCVAAVASAPVNPGAPLPNLVRFGLNPPARLATGLGIVPTSLVWDGQRYLAFSGVYMSTFGLDLVPTPAARLTTLDVGTAVSLAHAYGQVAILWNGPLGVQFGTIPNGTTAMSSPVSVTSGAIEPSIVPLGAGFLVLWDPGFPVLSGALVNRLGTSVNFEVGSSAMASLAGERVHLASNGPLALVVWGEEQPRFMTMDATGWTSEPTNLPLAGFAGARYVGAVWIGDRFLVAELDDSGVSAVGVTTDGVVSPVVRVPNPPASTVDAEIVAQGTRAAVLAIHRHADGSPDTLDLSSVDGQAGSSWLTLLTCGSVF